MREDSKSPGAVAACLANSFDMVAFMLSHRSVYILGFSVPCRLRNETAASKTSGPGTIKGALHGPPGSKSIEIAIDVVSQCQGVNVTCIRYHKGEECSAPDLTPKSRMSQTAHFERLN